MNKEEILTLLKKEAACVAEEIPDAIWYLFGSMLTDPASAADIDVLILYSEDKDAITLRHKLAQLCLSLPLHLFLVSRTEESELDFIHTQACRQFYPEPASSLI